MAVVIPGLPKDEPGTQEKRIGRWMGASNAHVALGSGFFAALRPGMTN